MEKQRTKIAITVGRTALDQCVFNITTQMLSENSGRNLARINEALIKDAQTIAELQETVRDNEYGRVKYEEDISKQRC